MPAVMVLGIYGKMKYLFMLDTKDFVEVLDSIFIQENLSIKGFAAVNCLEH